MIYLRSLPFVNVSLFLDNLGLTFKSELVLFDPDTLLTLLFVLLTLPDGCRTMKLSTFFPVSGSDLTGFDSVCSWLGLFFSFSPAFLPAELEGGDANESGSKLAAFPEVQASSFSLLKVSNWDSCVDGGGGLPVKETAVGWCLSTGLLLGSDGFRDFWDSITVDNFSWVFGGGSWDITSFVFSSLALSFNNTLSKKVFGVCFCE